VGTLAKVIVGTAVVGGLFAFASSASGSSRPPHLDPVPVPGRDAPWEPIDEALCLCWEARTATKDLLLCVLRRIYPEVAWPAISGDHQSVRDTNAAVGARAAQFVNAIVRGDRPCEAPKPVPGIVLEPVGPGGEEPVQPAGFDVIDPFSGGAELQHFARIIAGSNPTKLVRAALGGVPATDARVRLALRCMTATGWNLYFYSRPRTINQLNSGAEVKIGARWYDIGPAWLDANQDMHAAWEAGERPLRRVGWSGAKASQGKYGAPWLAFDAAGVCPGDDPWDPLRNPPPEVFERMGHNLDTMREVWEQNNGG
jgi:hypothetical protein